ncbi:MAG: hypothetical protein VW516_00085 [Rhodospirillaceae bacterium]|jgi:hypothetical protein
MHHRALARIRWLAIACMTGGAATASPSGRSLARRIIEHHLHLFKSPPCTRASVIAVLAPQPRARPFVETGARAWTR